MATDWANLRGFYAELQADYMETGKERTDITEKYPVSKDKHTSFTDLQGNTTKLKAGFFSVSFDEKMVIVLRIIVITSIQSV